MSKRHLANVAESEVEKHLGTRVKEFGGIHRKWTSPGHAGVEDRIIFLPEGEIWFIEVKKRGELPRDDQWREIFRHRNLGANAGYLAGIAEVDKFFKLTRGQRVEWMAGHCIMNCPKDWQK